MKVTTTTRVLLEIYFQTEVLLDGMFTNFYCNLFKQLNSQDLILLTYAIPLFIQEPG
jgi:hypothetical protein